MPRKSRKSPVEPHGKKRKRVVPFHHRLIYTGAILALVLYACSWVYREVSQSLFFTKKDRINIVVYQEYPTFYSFGLGEVGNYALTFYPDLRAEVPGGYGFYRLGALGKLVSLENDPEIYTRTFSGITTTFIDFSFYYPSEDVYYGIKDANKQNGKPSVRDVLMMKSNANLFDRIFILTLLNKIEPNSVHALDYLPYESVQNDTIFDTSRFLERLIGTFYQKTYRNENLNVQIHYTNSNSTAYYINSILNGNGIFVSDLIQKENDVKKCTIIEEKVDSFSYTAETLARFFNCDLKDGKTSIYDILFVLADLEESWQVKQ